MIKDKLSISVERLDEVNQLLLGSDSEITGGLLEVIDKYGGVEEINKKATEAGRLENLKAAMEKAQSPHYGDINWLIKQRDAHAFISVKDYQRKILDDKADMMFFNDNNAVALEICSAHYPLFLIEEAKQAIEKREMMPGRIIRVRNMKEQEANGDLPAVQAMAKIIGASCCETLDTKGTDGSNVNLGGPATITGYFGGVGQPNSHPIKWADEFLHYYTTFGVKEVLNVNYGTIIVGYMMHKLGINNEFKISVFTGHDNPYSIFWTLAAARLFSRADGTTPLKGLNFSNSVNNQTIEIAARMRKRLGLEDHVRFEHHILETTKSIVRQPYDRRNELLEIAGKVRNMSAKHEGGEINVDSRREHPSDILDYFLLKEQVSQASLMPHLLRNYLDKHDAVNNTAKALTERGFSFVAAKNLHYY